MVAWQSVLVVDWLNGAAFGLFGEPTTWAEVLGFAAGLLNVWLLVRQHVLNWPLGILNVALLMLVFWTAGLYADFGLQILYVLLGFYGWRAWLYGGTDHTRLTVRATGRAEWLAQAVVGVLLTGGLWVFLDRLTNSSATGRRGDHRAIASGHLRAEPQTGGELVALDRRRPDLHPALRL